MEAGASLGEEQPASVQQLVIIGMAADPEPDAVILTSDAKGAVMEADTRRPETANALEAERGVLRISLQQRNS